MAKEIELEKVILQHEISVKSYKPNIRCFVFFTFQCVRRFLSTLEDNWYLHL